MPSKINLSLSQLNYNAPNTGMWNLSVKPGFTTFYTFYTFYQHSHYKWLVGAEHHNQQPRNLQHILLQLRTRRNFDNGYQEKPTMTINSPTMQLQTFYPPISRITYEQLRILTQRLEHFAKFYQRTPRISDKMPVH